MDDAVRLTAYAYLAVESDLLARQMVIGHAGSRIQRAQRARAQDSLARFARAAHQPYRTPTDRLKVYRRAHEVLRKNPVMLRAWLKQREGKVH